MKTLRWAIPAVLTTALLLVPACVPDPLDRDAGQLAMTIETTNLGHYREPDGRIGAAQLVSIPRATEFVAQLNDLISRALLRERGRRQPELPRTMERIWDAAAAGHEWIALRGHSIRASLPVHPARSPSASPVSGHYGTANRASPRPPWSWIRTSSPPTGRAGTSRS